MQVHEYVQIILFKMIYNSTAKCNHSGPEEDSMAILDAFYKRREIFDEYIREKEILSFTCPSCAYPTLGERGGYEICSICDWEDDSQDDPRADEVWGGPNSNFSLTESRLRIGRIFKNLEKKLNSIIELNPSIVIKVIQSREIKIESFLKEKITMKTNINDPIWEKYRQFKQDSLEMLIKGKDNQMI